MAECETNLSDSMTFKDKKKFFEREIAQQASIAPKDKGRKFSFLQEHEVATLKNEEAKRLSTGSQGFPDATNNENDMQTDIQADIPTDFNLLISDLTNRKTTNCKSATERLFGKKAVMTNSLVRLSDRMTSSTEDRNEFVDADSKVNK